MLFDSLFNKYYN